MVQVGAKVTRNAHEAARLVALGTPVVLVSETAASAQSSALGPGLRCRSLPEALCVPHCDPPGLVAFMVGSPGTELDAAAAEMAAELFVWARTDGAGGPAPHPA